LAWIVLVPALIALRRASGWGAAGLAALLALTGTCATVHWLPRTVSGYYQQPAVVGVALFLAVTLVMVIPPLVVFTLAYRRLAATARPHVPLLAGSAWVATDYMRAHVLTGNPWVLFGYSQVGMSPVAQIADVTSVYGPSFLLAATNVAIAEWWMARGGTAEERGRARQGLTGVALVLGVVLAYGTARLMARPSDGSSVEVTVIQGNLDLGSQWREEFYGRNLDIYLRLTLQALRAEKPRLVVWPESTMTFFLADQPLYQAAIGHVLEAFGAELVAGGPYTASPDAAVPIFHNAAFSLAPSGRITARYDKEHLLPFAEYFPLRLDLLRRKFGRVREFTPGTTTSLLPTVAGLAGVLICNEAMFPEVARDRVRAGAELLVNLTNDTWVGDRTFSSIAFDMAVLRAIEQRRYLVRASTAGPSAIVDPWGRIVTETPLFTQTTATGRVAPARGLTPYARLGDAFAVACGLVAAAALARPARPG